MKLDRFYPIFDSIDWLERMLPLSVKLVQLRIKDMPEPELRHAVTEARVLCQKHDTILILNDYWQVAIDAGCDWIHLGQEDLDDADIPAIRRAGIRLGISTHDRDELERAMRHTPDYVALGPVYPTKLKKMKWHQQGLEKLSEWKGLIGQTPLVAIGGMTVERAQGALDAGADIVSAVTDITWNDDPEARVKAWIEATR